MRKIMICSLLLYNAFSFGQVGFSNQTISINGHQVEVIQSTLFMDIQPHNCPKLDTFEISLSQDTLHINYYYDARVSSIGMGCIQTDTISIDSLPIGNYTLIFHVHEIIGHTTTSDTLYNQALDTAQIIITNSSNLNKDEFVSFFPNPVHDYLNIKTINAKVEEIYLFTIQGQLIKKIPKDKKRWNLQYLENGVYVLKIKTDAGWLNQKIIKQ